MRNMRSAVIVRHSTASVVVVVSDGQFVWNGPQTRNVDYNQTDVSCNKLLL